MLAKWEYKMINELNIIIERSLKEFITYVRDQSWFGRENEAVSLYAFGFLQRECSTTGPLIDPTQIGIEVGAARTPKGPNSRVRKDLVIWPRPGMNCWYPTSDISNNPIAILEWKVCRPKTSTLKGKKHDIEWLKAHTSTHKECVGYSVELNLVMQPPLLNVSRFYQSQEVAVVIN